MKIRVPRTFSYNARPWGPVSVGSGDGCLQCLCPEGCRGAGGACPCRGWPRGPVGLAGHVLARGREEAVPGSCVRAVWQMLPEGPTRIKNVS